MAEVMLHIQNLGVYATVFALIFLLYLFYNPRSVSLLILPISITYQRTLCQSSQHANAIAFLHGSSHVRTKKQYNLLKIQATEKQIGYYEFSIFFFLMLHKSG